MHPKFKKNFERKQTATGKPNPKYVDALEQDAPIRDQNYVCMSFISPEKIIKDKERFIFGEFVRQWEFNKSVEKFVDFLYFISSKYSVNFDTMSADFKEFFESEKAKIFTTIEDDFKNYVDKNGEELEKKFTKDNAFQTNVRGVKIRGVYATEKDAHDRCQLLREKDPAHDIFVGEVGVWMPFDPDAYKTGRVQYIEEELNQLANNKIENEKLAKTEFENRVKDSKRTAIEENMKMAEKTGNRLTQTLDADGELVEVANIVRAMDGTTHVMKTAEAELKERGVESGADDVAVERVLFDTSTVVTDKHTDHGKSQLISGPFASAL